MEAIRDDKTEFDSCKLICNSSTFPVNSLMSCITRATLLRGSVEEFHLMLYPLRLSAALWVNKTLPSPTGGRHLSLPLSLSLTFSPAMSGSEVCFHSPLHQQKSRAVPTNPSSSFLPPSLPSPDVTGPPYRGSRARKGQSRLIKKTCPPTRIRYGP